VSARDHNALTFGQPSGPTVQQYTEAIKTISTPKKVYTQKPIEVSSELVLGSVSASWAVKNRAALTATLRDVLKLRSDEDLVITSINGNRRARNLQAGVKIEFTVGVSDPSRASASKQKLTSLSSGSAAMIRQFSAQLDVELESRGEATVSLPVEAFDFAQPTQVVKAEAGPTTFQAAGTYNYNQAAYAPIAQTEEEEAASTSSNSSTLLLILAGGLCFSLVLLAYYRGKASGPAEPAIEAPDAYASKVAHLDQMQNEFEMEQ